MAQASVNGTLIDTRSIAAEAQHHPAESGDAAALAATRALVVRELLLQQARRAGIRPDPQHDTQGRTETRDNAMLRQLLQSEIAVPVADRAACRRFYAENRHRFLSPALFEPAHILLAASPRDPESYENAVREAKLIIAELDAAPERFDAIALTRSDCSSKQQGGRLGQVMLRDVVPEFATFLSNLEEGQLCPVPVKTRYGVHVLRLDRKAEREVLPFESVAGRIADYLQERDWRRAVARYIQCVAAGSSVQGVTLDSESRHRDSG